MDTSDPDIHFDSEGVCNHCRSYDHRIKRRVFTGSEAKTKYAALIKKIKKRGRKKEYDCIIGVSGGVDSTYVAWLVKKEGLRPLAIHFDNGWNSELAVSNIEKVLKKLDIDLYTYVIDWNEFRGLQIAFIKASTPDGEIPTDHAINALLFKEASRRGIKFIITGMNFATEAAAIPAWAYGHSDWKYIKNINRTFGNRKLKNYPHFNLWYLFFVTFFKRIKVISLLNYMDYNKESAVNLLKKNLGWSYYGGKHYESVYTRFYQSYILPRKFNIDKRRAHLSDLINSGQITRNQAIKEIKAQVCPNNMLEDDKQFVMKKFGFLNKDLDDIIKSDHKSFRDYKNNYNKIYALKKLVNFLRNKGWYSK